MARGRTRKPKSLEKRIPYKLIPRKSTAGEHLYEMLDDLVEKHHEELDHGKARIALAWALNWKPDADGVQKLGRCKKASDLDRELAEWDFVILLNQAWFEDAAVTEPQRLALLDHELCHADVRLDKNGERVVDERGRTVFRMRKHDIEEFSEVVRRHGIYKRDLEQFAASLAHGKGAKQLALLIDKVKTPNAPEPTKGTDATVRH